MSWLGLSGHDTIVEQFRRSLEQGRLASTFLFVGPEGIGKRTFALRLAQSLLCERSLDTELNACASCAACRQVMAGTHGDLLVVSLPEGKSSIPLELLIGSPERRMREGLCHDIAMKPGPGSRKIAIIDDADYLGHEGANCLLKTLEEPPPKSLIILVGTSEQRQVPTIRSRAQMVRFRPLSDELVARLLLEHADVHDEAHAAELASLAHGSFAVARQLADGELWSFREQLLSHLSRREWDALEVARRVSEFVDAAGTEAPLRRARMRLIIEVVHQFYRQVMRLAIGHQAAGDEGLRQAAAEAARWWAGGDPQSPARLVERCIEAHSEVDANANQATLLASWIDDLAQISSGQPVWTASRSTKSFI